MLFSGGRHAPKDNIERLRLQPHDKVDATRNRYLMRGLENKGNTCYALAVIQALIHIDVFRDSVDVNDRNHPLMRQL